MEITLLIWCMVCTYDVGFWNLVYKDYDFNELLLFLLDIIGVVDNVRCNPQSKNVIFHIRDLRLVIIYYVF